MRCWPRWSIRVGHERRSMAVSTLPVVGCVGIRRVGRGARRRCASGEASARGGLLRWRLLGAEERGDEPRSSGAAATFRGGRWLHGGFYGCLVVGGAGLGFRGGLRSGAAAVGTGAGDVEVGEAFEAFDAGDEAGGVGVGLGEGGSHEGELEGQPGPVVQRMSFWAARRSSMTRASSAGVNFVAWARRCS